MLFNWTWGHYSFLKMRFTFSDLVSFILILHFISQVYIWLKWFCKMSDVIGSSWVLFLHKIRVSCSFCWANKEFFESCFAAILCWFWGYVTRDGTLTLQGGLTLSCAISHGHIKLNPGTHHQHHDAQLLDTHTQFHHENHPSWCDIARSQSQSNFEK